MMKGIVLVTAAALALASCKKSGGAAETPAGGGATASGPSLPPPDSAYDASRDSAADLKAALAAAKAGHKRVLIEVGSKSCAMCQAMDRFLEKNSDLAASRDAQYATIRVHAEAGAAVPAVLSKFPAPDGYPHCYVLDENGSLIESQDMSKLQKGADYDAEKFAFFLKTFGPNRPPKK